MSRRTSITLIAVVLLAGSGKSYAQSDMDDVKAAVAAYHAALSALDAPKMEALWMQDNSVMDIEPSDKSISVGWDAVKKNFESEFNAFSELKVTQADGPHIQVKGDVAWSTGIANSTLKTKAGAVANGPVFETDVFEKRDGHWLLVSHTALRVPQ
jgi:ketosteroid isomerase-like protein